MYLIIGASGFIGKHLYDYCKNNKISVLGTYFSHSNYPEWIKFDIRVDNVMEICIKYLNGEIPDAVIICGANSSIDSCKKNERESENLNVIGTKRIIQQVNELCTMCVYLSSESVFDGDRGMYTEEDIPNPQTVYGRQKLQIERYIIQNVKKYLIFRISRAVGCGFGEKDIFDEFYNRMICQEEIICLKNQSFCLTEVNDIVIGILKMLERNIVGLFHLSSNNYISRYELAQLYGNMMFGGYNKIIEKDYANMSFYDNRHINGGLCGDKIEKILAIHFKSITEIFEQYNNSYKVCKFRS